MIRRMIGKKRMKDILNPLFPPVSANEMAAAGERVLQRLHDEMPQEIQEFLPRLRNRVKAEELRPIDQHVLTALRLLRGDATHGRIRKKVDELTSRQNGLNSLYTSLFRLEDQGLVSMRIGTVDGLERHLYSITETGSQVLALASPVQPTIEKLGDFA
jgi:hypothetical protein